MTTFAPTRGYQNLSVQAVSLELLPRGGGPSSPGPRSSPARRPTPSSVTVDGLGELYRPRSDAVHPVDDAVMPLLPLHRRCASAPARACPRPARAVARKGRGPWAPAVSVYAGAAVGLALMLQADAPGLTRLGMCLWLVTGNYSLCRGGGCAQSLVPWVLGNFTGAAMAATHHLAMRR